MPKMYLNRMKRTKIAYSELKQTKVDYKRDRREQNWTKIFQNQEKAISKRSNDSNIYCEDIQSVAIEVTHFSKPKIDINLLPFNKNSII